MMQILIICKKAPFPETDGEAIAISSWIRGLHRQGCQLTVCVISTKKHPFQITQVPQELQQSVLWYNQFVDTSIRIWPAFKNLFIPGQSYNVQRFVDARFKRLLSTLLQQNSYDIIQVENLFLASYLPWIRKMCNTPVVLRSHNVEHLIWQKLAKNEKNRIKKLYLKFLAGRLERFEKQVSKKFDALVPISEIDAQTFHSWGLDLPMEILPGGLEPDKYRLKERYDTGKMFFLGGLDWLPNLEGLQWFLKEIWPEIHEKNPKAEFRIAGRNAPAWLKELNMEGLRFLGKIDDSGELFRNGGVMVIPLLSGSGIRIKLMEAMMYGVPVVTTGQGREGIPGKEEKHWLQADEAKLFASKVLSLVNDVPLQRQLGNASRKLAEEIFGIDALSEKLIRFYKSLVRDMG